MIKIENDKKVFVTSDTHLFHTKDFVWEARGFNSPLEHAEGVIASINDKVGPNDILIHLGDWCLNSTIEQFEYSINKINCRTIYMLFGNHPNPHYKQVYVPMVKQILGKHYEDGMELYPLRYKNIVYLGHYAEMLIRGEMFVLSHYPFLIWNQMQHGSLHISGHSHGGCNQTNSKCTFGKVLDCGWDEFKSPLSIEEVLKIMSKKVNYSIDHH